MFTNIFQFLKGKDFLTQVLSDFKDMLDDTEIMFTDMCQVLVKGEKIEGLEAKIYEIDKKVNSQERAIRKRIVEHLVIQPTMDVSTSLILMSVVKDAERLGDYCKNLFEITKIIDTPLDNEKYKKHFDSVDETICELFKYAKKAFIDSDEDKAQATWEEKKDVAKRCEEIILEIAKSGYPSSEAVAFTLMARYYKRLAAHLTNIATAVLVPISDLDYFEERKK